MMDVTTPPNPAPAAPDWEALARYLAGESSAEEARRVAAWLAAHPESVDVLATLELAIARPATGAPWLTSTNAGASIDVDAAWQRLRRRQDEPADDPQAPRVLPLRPVQAARRGPRIGLAVAATLAIAAGLTWWRAGRETASPARIVQTAVGVRDSVRLPDGTRIVLAPASRLVVGAGYGAGVREVTLVGAAAFDVRHDAAHPFVVRAGGAVIRDVGTVFTVRTDGIGAGDGVAVTVSEGAVAFDISHAGAKTSSGGLVLAAGDRAELGANGRVVAMRGAATGADTAWMHGRLVYQGTPLAAVRADLRRWYGVDVQVADPALAARRLTATFENDSIADVLDVVARSLDARVERTGTGTFTLRPLGSGVR